MAGKRSSKSLGPRENDRIRAQVQKIIDEQFGHNVSAAARAWGVKQPTLFAFLYSNKGIGMQLAPIIAGVLGMTVDEMIGKPLKRVVHDEQWPNRAAAVQAARALGTVTEEAIASVLDQDFGSDGDLTPDEWLDEMRSAERRLRRRVVHVVQVVPEFDEAPVIPRLPPKNRG